MDWQVEPLFEFVRKPLHFFRLSSFCPAQAKRISNHDFRDSVVVNNARKPLKIQALILPADGVKSCAVMPRGSETARPMDFEPTSSPRTRGLRQCAAPSSSMVELYELCQVRLAVRRLREI